MAVKKTRNRVAATLAVVPRHKSPHDAQYHDPDTIETLTKICMGLLETQGEMQEKIDSLESRLSALEALKEASPKSYEVAHDY